MTNKEYQEITGRFNRIVAEISAFDNLVENCLDDRQTYLDFNDRVVELLGEMGNIAELLDLDTEI